MTIDAIILANSDNVATVLTDVAANSEIVIKNGERVSQFQSKEKIPYGFKIALNRIEKGQKIIKYGEVIGQATETIHSGFVVHVHNVESLRGRGDLN